MKQSACAPIDPIVDRQRQRVISQLIPKVMEQLELPGVTSHAAIQSITSNLYDLIEAIRVIETQLEQGEISPDTLRQVIEPLETNQVLGQLDEQLRAVNDSSGRVQRIMQSVYEFSKSSEVRAVYKFARDPKGTHRERIALNHVIEDTLKLMKSYLDLRETSRVQVVKEYDSSLPLIEGNLGSVRQMVLELLSCSIFRVRERDRQQREAARPSPRGIVKICTTQHDSLGVELRIVDNGTAISADQWNQIVDAHTDSQPNLAGCQRVIDLHQGKLSFLNAVKETAIIATLPLQQN